MSHIGTLLPIFAFDSNKLLQQSHQFIDWLKANNQSYWQILPINLQPLTEPSPYSSYAIGLQIPLQSEISPKQRQVFLSRHPWIRDVSIFLALRDQFETDQHWTWPDEFKNYPPTHLIEFSLNHKLQIQQRIDQQIASHILWSQIKSYANSQGIHIIGDLPFYLDRRSPLVWANQSLFTNIHPDSPWTSGVPASSNYPKQVWDHPLYHWENLKQLKYLWQLRLHHAKSLYDYLRIDHSIGFFHYGVMHKLDESLDHVSDGPGSKIFNFIYQTAQFYKLNLIAETVTDFEANQLNQSLAAYHIPDCRVFTQGFKNNQLDPYFTDCGKYPQLTVAYSSNHDTEPLVPWLESLPDEIWLELKHQLKLDPQTPAPDLAIAIRQQIIQSPAQIVIIPIQDWLLSDDRINTPGKKNTWQMTSWESLSKHLPLNNP